MYSNEIVVTTSSFSSSNMLEIIYSNSSFLEQLFKKQIKKSEVSPDALKSYYVHFYQEQVTHLGFLNFMYKYSNEKEVIHNIEYALHGMKCFQHLEHFNKVMHIIKRVKGMHNIEKVLEIKTTSEEGNIFDFFDKRFIQINQNENLTTYNYKWLMNHADLQLIASEGIENKVLEIQLDIMARYKMENPKHVQIIKALCKKVNMKYKCITAGDPNNIYNSSWYFITESGHYYMVEKNREAKMFSSKTKSKIATISTNAYY